MQNKRYITIEDFLNSDTFTDGVRSGHTTPEWNDWLENNPDKIHLYQEARNIILALGTTPEPDDWDTELALAKSWERIRDTEPVDRKTYLFSWWRVAAAAVLVIGLVFSVRKFSTFDSKGHLSFSDYVWQRERLEHNVTDKIQVVNLEDGSTVLLQPGAKLSYPVQFDVASRKVHLSGEAFFEISKNPDRPFLVYTADIVTRVVGTSFRVKALEGEPAVEVLVKTGKVNVSRLEADQSVLKAVDVLPNESVSFLRENKSFGKKHVAVQSPRTIETVSFDFEDAPVQNIFTAIEAGYGLEVQYPAAVLKNCYLSTSLSDQPLLEKLKIICESLGPGTSFDLAEDKIIIHSNGCNTL